MDLSKLLQQLLVELTNLGSPLVPFLQPGVDEEYIREKTKEIPFPMPQELCAFYGWKNGVTNKDVEDYPLKTFELFTLANPISIEDSIEIYNFHADENNYWEKRYFPIFESGLGDYFLLDIDQKSDSHGMIMFWSPSDPYFQGVISIADSFVSLVETLLKCYKERIYYLEMNAEGRKVLNCDPKTEHYIWENNNPKSRYYKVLQSFNH